MPITTQPPPPVDANSTPPAAADLRAASSPSPGRWRSIVVVMIPALAAIAIALRLIDLQWSRHAELAARAQNIQTWQEPIPARPGDILDREGRLLATSLSAPSLYVDPHHVTDAAALAEQLAPAVNMDGDTLRDRLRSATGQRFVWIKRRLTATEAEAVQALRLPREVAGLREEFRRHYPQGTIAAHLLGLRDVDNTGRGGLEEACAAELCGSAGSRVVQRDARGFVVDVLSTQSVPPTHGQTVRCTIDSVLQLQVEEELETVVRDWSPKSAAAILIDPRTGEILAIASRPAFDPSDPGATDEVAWKNQAVAAVFEPGSTMKPLVVAWALDHGIVATDEIFDCEFGVYQMGRRLLHDHHAYGDLSLTDVLVKSSNIGMAKIGERLGNSELQALVRAFGFGRPTGVKLPGELRGIVRDDRDWDGFSTGSVPMGQEIAVTPLQLIAAHQILANGGRYLPLTLVRIDTTTASAPPLHHERPIVSEAAANWVVREALTAVVERGTGRAAQIEGYAVFGKTGTSQVVDAETGRYSHARHICSFIGGVPANNPELLVLVTVEEPNGTGADSGGRVAAPAARNILERSLRYLAIPPTIAEAAETVTR